MKNLQVEQHTQFSNIKEFYEIEKQLIGSSFCEVKKTLFSVTNQRMKDEDFEKQIKLIQIAQPMFEALEKIITEGYKKLERGEIDTFTGAVIETAEAAIKRATNP